MASFNLQVMGCLHNPGTDSIYSQTPHNPYPLHGQPVLWVMGGYGLGKML
jgi:hypothetical protein